jgi:hypothetical protein
LGIVEPAKAHVFSRLGNSWYEIESEMSVGKGIARGARAMLPNNPTTAVPSILVIETTYGRISEPRNLAEKLLFVGRICTYGLPVIRTSAALDRQTSDFAGVITCCQKFDDKIPLRSNGAEKCGNLNYCASPWCLVLALQRAQ